MSRRPVDRQLCGRAGVISSQQHANKIKTKPAMPILWLPFAFLLSVYPGQEKLVILEKEITVSGNTSLGKFDCIYHVTGLKDTLSFMDNKSKDVFLFDIAVTDFGCGNFLLNNDFRKIIKAKEFPEAHVK